MATGTLQPVHSNPAGNGGKVEVAPGGRCRAEDGRPVIDLIGNQGRGADAGQIAQGRRAVAVLDDLDGGKNLAHGRKGRRLVARAGGEVAGEAQADFAFRTGATQAGIRHPGAAGVQVGGQHEAGGGAGQAEIVLHALGGGADLEAGGWDGARAAGTFELDRHALVDGGRADRFGE